MSSTKDKNLDWLKSSKVAHLNEGLIYPPGQMNVKRQKKSVSRPMGRHLTEEGRTDFANMCEAEGLPRPVAEYKPFLDTLGRKHAVDFYFEKDGKRLALEIEGWGHRTRDRHTADIFKYNELTLHGIFKIQVKPKHLYLPDTFMLIKRFFNI